MPLILSGNVASATADAGYTVANSCRFDRGSSAYMHKTPGGAGSLTTWTISAWVKRANEHGTNSYILDCGAGNGTSLYFGPAAIEFWDYQSGYTGRLTTNAVYRDHSAWMHIVAVWDTTNGTAGDRMKLYVNGTEVTSFATDTNPSSSQASILSSTTQITIGSQGTSIYANLYMAEVCFIDGQALTPSSFGEFDEDSPTIWKPKDVSGLTFGTNGFYLDFEDSANLGNDANGGTDLTSVNLDATDSATDVPTNNFATLNPLYLAATSYTIEEGNLQITASASNAWRSLYTTMPVTSGKWYYEMKLDAEYGGAGIGNFTPGIVDIEQVVQTSSNGKFFGTSRGYAYHAKDGKKLNNDTVTDNGADYGDAWTTGDIVGCAFDLDNQKIYWSKNGTWQDSGDPTSGATGTGSAFDIGSGYTYTPAMANYYTTENYSFNFGGCPAFAITSNSGSGYQDANGFGKMEYAFPDTDYYCLCTANLAEFG